MPQVTRSRFGLMPARQIPVTAVICAVLLVLSLAGMVGDRAFGYGISTLDYRLGAILQAELWRLLTHGFVDSSPISLLIDILVLWLFGGWFEVRYGRRDYARFFIASVIGAGVLAVPLTYLTNLVMPFVDPGYAQGPGAAVDAMIMSLAITLPDSNILLGFVIPMRARTAIYILLGITIVFGILAGAATLGITLGGLAMGYLLTTGNWRPSRILGFMKIWRLRRRRRGFYVVPPKDDETLH
jgi:membrane associated rhomboid family serine protease